MIALASVIAVGKVIGYVGHQPHRQLSAWGRDEIKEALLVRCRVVVLVLGEDCSATELWLGR